MKKILPYFKQLGFSEIEAKVYITLLKSGPTTVASLAEKAKINRTATYSHINSLLEKGIIAKVKGSANKIAANPPDQLHFLVEQKAIQISMLQEKLPSIISVLNSLPQTDKPLQSEIRYAKGRNGVKAIYKEVLRSKKIRAYFNPEDIENIFPENTKLFNDALLLNKNMAIHELVQDNEAAIREMTYFDNEKHLYKTLPKDVTLTANDILIYDGKVAIINIGDKNDISGVVLQNKDYYNNSVQLFDLLWRLLPEPTL